MGLHNPVDNPHYTLTTQVKQGLIGLRGRMFKAGETPTKVCGWGVYSYDFLLLPSTSYYS